MPIFAFLLFFFSLNCFCTGAQTSDIPSASFEVPEITIPGTLQEQKDAGFGAALKALGGGTISKYTDGKGACNIGLYDYDVDGQKKFIKVVSIHRYAQEKEGFTCVKQAACDDFIIVPSRVVLLDDAALLFMDKASGIHLKEAEDLLGISDKSFENLANIFCRMTEKGLCHGDLHFENIFYDPETYRWAIIDTSSFSKSTGPTASALKEALSLFATVTKHVTTKLRDASNPTQAHLEKLIQTIMDILQKREDLLQKVKSEIPAESLSALNTQGTTLLKNILITLDERQLEEAQDFCKKDRKTQENYMLSKYNDRSSLFYFNNYTSDKAYVLLTRGAFVDEALELLKNEPVPETRTERFLRLRRERLARQQTAT